MAKAEATQIVVNLPIYRESVSEREMLTEAGLLAGRTIEQQFHRNPALADVQVLVMANRNGEVIPLLEATVSRSEWQEQPSISLWTRYYSASFELVQRHDEQISTLVVSSPGRATASSGSSSTGQVTSSSRSTPLIDQLVDNGRLNGVSAQEVLSSID